MAEAQSEESCQSGDISEVGLIKYSVRKRPTEFVSFGCVLDDFPSYDDISCELESFKYFNKLNIPIDFKSWAKVCQGLTVDLTLSRGRIDSLRFRLDVNGTTQYKDSDEKVQELLRITGQRIELCNGDEVILKTNCSDFMIKREDWPSTINKLRFTISGEVEYRSHKDMSFIASCDLRSSKAPKYPQYLFSDTLSDIVIKCGEEELPAHGFILGNASPVFSKMVSMDMKEKKEKSICMNHVTPDVCKLILRFIYTGSVELNTDEGNEEDDVCVSFIQEIYTSADMYELTGLKVICENKLISMVNLNNVVKLYKWTMVHHGVTNLKAVTMNFFSANRKAVFEKYTFEGMVNDCREIVNFLLGI